MYPVFKELGIADAIKFHYPERFRQISMNGRILTVYTDIDKFELELLRLFPEEKTAIVNFCRLIFWYTKFNPPMDGDFGSFGIASFLKMLPFMPSFFLLTKISFKRFLTKRFRNPDLIEMLFQMFPVVDLPALMPVMAFAFFNRKEGGYPLGGSLNFAHAIEKKYLDLGGSLFCNSKVQKILVENNCAKGIVLENGKKILGDIVISACDGKTTLFSLLENRSIPKKLLQLYQKPSLWPPLICISLGVNRDVSESVELNNIHLKTPVVICGKKISWFYFAHYCHDSHFCPKNKSVITIQIETDYDYWEKISNNKNDYQKEKQSVLTWAIATLEEQFPGIKEQIEVTDIATPISWVKYTGNWQGSYEGWLPTKKLFGKVLPKKLPNLENFWMTGQWVFPGGGVPMCMVQGKNIMRMIVKNEKIKGRRAEEILQPDMA